MRGDRPMPDPTRPRRRRRAAAVLAAAVVLLPAACARAAPAIGADGITRGTIPYDHYTAGLGVDVDATVLGDLVAAGGWVDIEGRVAGDLAAAGGDVSVAAEVDDDARLAGARVRLDGHVRDHVVAAGGSVVVGPEARIDGRLWIGATAVSIAGHAGGPVRINAREVTLAGRIEGPVEVTAETLTVRPGARIAGDLRYRARAPARIADEARVAGDVQFERWSESASGGEPAQDSAWPSLSGLLLATAGLTLVGGLLRLLFPGFVGGSAELLRREPLLSLGVGALVAVVAPIVLIMIGLLVITLPVTLVGLLLLPPALLGGYLLFAFFVVERGNARLRDGRPLGSWQAVAALALAVLALALVQALPWIGPLVGIAAVLLGTGAGAALLGRRYRAARAGS